MTTDTIHTGEDTTKDLYRPALLGLTEGSPDLKPLGEGWGMGPLLTERMASLIRVSRWSFLRMAPVSGQVKYTPGAAR